METIVGTLRFNEFEGGFWSIEPEDDRAACVLQGWTPPAAQADVAPLTDGSRVRARIRVREEQIGFLMAGTYVDVLEIAPA